MVRAASPVLIGVLAVAIIVGGLAGAGVTGLTAPAAAPPRRASGHLHPGGRGDRSPSRELCDGAT